VSAILAAAFSEQYTQLPCGTDVAGVEHGAGAQYRAGTGSQYVDKR